MYSLEVTIAKPSNSLEPLTSLVENTLEQVLMNATSGGQFWEISKSK